MSKRTHGLRMFGVRASLFDQEPLPCGSKFRPRQAHCLPKDRNLRQKPRVRVLRQVGHQLLEDRCGRKRRMRLNLTYGIRENFGWVRGRHTPGRVRHHLHQ